MTIHETICSAFPARKTEATKKAFRQYILQNYGGTEQTTKDGKNTNIVIGDPSGAKVLLTAHYDTPAASLFPNMMVPRHTAVFLFFQMIPVFVLLALSALAALCTGALLPQYERAPYLAFLLTYYILFALMFAFVNPNNYNDNTSGVATLLSIVENYRGNDVAFILFDNEEKGKKGSKGFFKDNKALLEHTLLINFDCVGNGRNLIFVVPKSISEAPETLLLQECFPGCDQYSTHFFPRESSNCNSDHKNFPKGIGCMACKQTKGGIFYTPNIHTRKDTFADQSNIAYLSEKTVDFLNRLTSGN